MGGRYYSGTGYSTTVPPISASLEFGVADGLAGGKGSFGVAPYIGYTASKYKYSPNVDWGYNYSSTVVGLRGAFHYALASKLDTYLGLMLGYNIVSAKEYGANGTGIVYSASSSGFAWDGFLGARYYFTPKFGAFLELGYGIGYGNLGVAIKL